MLVFLFHFLCLWNFLKNLEIEFSYVYFAKYNKLLHK